jgi:isopenicillin-N N-acyltransferase like protein
VVGLVKQSILCQIRPMQIQLLCGCRSLLALALATILACPWHGLAVDADKEDSVLSGLTSPSGPGVRGSLANQIGGGGYRFELTNGVSRVSVVVVGGTPYQMGWHLGRLMQAEIQAFVPVVLASFMADLRVSAEQLDLTWSTTAAFTDNRFKQELLGVAEGAELPLRTLQHVHTLPLLMPYSCSSIAAWGDATDDGHLYQTRNLDWSLQAGAHEFPVIVLYLPASGTPHVHPTFAGVIGANCGLNAAGIVLAEMGDSPRSEMPYATHAPHFTTWFRTLLYDAANLTEAVDTFLSIPQTKRYHFVFGDGRQEKRAVKILAHSPEPPDRRIRIWRDNDPTDELAPRVLPGVVYQDEGRGAFPTLQAKHGRLNAERLIALANQIPIRGGNVLNAVFDATSLRLWVAYAGGSREAYQRPYVHLDLMTLDADQDGRPDIEEGGRDTSGNGRPDFLDPNPAEE